MKTVKIKDYYGVEQSVTVSDEVYEALRELRREEDRLRKKIKYYHSTLTPDDFAVAGRVRSEDNVVEDEVVRRDDAKRLYRAITQLTPTQQRRILLLLEDMNAAQIAKMEGKHPSVIYRSIEGSFARLRRILKN